ncbi:MAG TPA: hypothetical protein ACFYD7_03965 [Candidatus Wujingus californicus]|uniref:hypothetical protein n=1 Tax=Candidatus Wujingus californicus TaxID=3367618 RepID=UPI001D832276|nr:hypothetical protein [Planctomycetota bacterium]MDO8131548.1 hypothetical protein [Candidatus Brocadiales bacterium]
MSDFNINKDDILFKVYKYELDRGKEGRILIDICEVIAGEYKVKFAAVPNLLLTSAKEEYIGYGDSDIEALKNCLNLIKDVPNSLIIESSPLPDES